MKQSRNVCRSVWQYMVTGLALCSLFFFAAPAFSWDSVGYENHRRLADDGAQSLQAAYPDVYKYLGDWYSGLIMDGSGTEASHTDPYSHIETWADPLGLQNWLLLAKTEYLAQNIKTAYNHLGYAVHLAQDNFVPAHAQVIYHGLLHLDYFELYADWNHAYVSTSTPWTFPLPYGSGEQRGYWLTDSEDDDDDDDNPMDVNDATTTDGTNAYQITSTWGSYGLGSAADYLPGNVNSSGDYFLTRPVEAIAHEQLQLALNETVSKLTEFSTKMPPVTKDLSLASSEIDTTNGTALNFKVMENRTQGVNVTLQVSETGQTIKTEDGADWNNLAKNLVSYPDAGDTSHLPWEDSYTLVWKGAVSSGACLNGDYTLELVIQDADANTSQSATIPFSISNAVSITRELTPPVVSVVEPGGVLGPFFVRETNNVGCEAQFNVQWYVVKPDGTSTWFNQRSTTLAAGQTLTHRLVFPIPASSGAGDFVLGILATDANGNQIAHNSFGFTVLEIPE